uniref:Uncharacterized protein n=1 Tax=Anopheles farauti TaxID=69004 RepID=A0A182Q7I0_9DIPT
MSRRVCVNLASFSPSCTSYRSRIVTASVCSAMSSEFIQAIDGPDHRMPLATKSALVSMDFSYRGQSTGVAVTDHESTKEQKRQQNRHGQHVVRQGDGLFHVQAEHEEDRVEQLIPIFGTGTKMDIPPYAFRYKNGRSPHAEQYADH